MSGATTDDLHEWLVRYYHDYVVSDEPVRGTYGLIWFLTKQDSTPETFAVKTLAPEALANPKSENDLVYLRREFRMWLALPDHLNVVPALGFDTANLSTGDGGGTISLPVMRMPRMAGSLQEWVDDPVVRNESRLIALAQSFNGLLHLYKHGFEGHGDLKPSNILFEDLRVRFGLDGRQGWPSIETPWHIRIADLGWADAWTDLGFTTKAWRKYLAPERLKGHVVPRKSDMFSMGMVVSELLQRRHPASNLKKAQESEGKWIRCVEERDWNLDGIASERMRQLILKCIDSDPTRRPTPDECLTEICSEVSDAFGYDIRPTLELWNKPRLVIANNEHAAWAALKATGLGAAETRRARQELERRTDEVIVRDFETCDSWITLATALIKLLGQEEGSDTAHQIAQLRKVARTYLTGILGAIDKSGLDAVTRRDDWPALVQPFERFAGAISQAAEAADVTFESMAEGPVTVTPYALAALAYGNASRSHEDAGASDREDFFLSEAIRLAPQEAVPYYFRASWRWSRWLLKSVVQGASAPNADELAVWVADLEAAARLSPDWAEPIKLLQALRKGGA